MEMKSNFVILVAFLIVLQITFVFTQKSYCKICSKHSLCLYPDPGPSKYCGTPINSGLTDDEKKSILKLHNDLRQKVVEGEESRGSPGPQPAAKELKDLVWDKELEISAQRWADQCAQYPDACRDVDRFGVGQNIGYRGTEMDVNLISPLNIVQEWYDQVQYFSKDQVPQFLNKGADNRYIGTYTQIVWEKTKYIGCGVTRYKDRGYNIISLVCNYGPTGNLYKRPVYKTT